MESIKNNKTSYYSTITNEYNNIKSIYYLGVKFKKGMELDKSSMLDIKNFFFSCYPSGNNQTKLMIIVTDYEKLEENRNAFEEYNDEREEYADFGDIQISDDQIAF